MTASDKDIAWLLSEKYKGERTPAFERDCKRLAGGEPLAYVIGTVPFWDCMIDLSSHPLIPRPETEWWVERVAQKIASDTHLRILDIFTGSGCIGVALLKHLPHAHVDFAEYDSAHIKTVEKNIELNGIDTARTRIFHSDVFTNIPPATYDYICANPPYIDADAPDTVQNSVLTWEPHHALFASEGGTHYIKRLLEQSRSYIKDGGIIFIEHAPEQKKAIEELSNTYGYTRTNFWKDQCGRLRIALVHK